MSAPSPSTRRALLAIAAAALAANLLVAARNDFWFDEMFTYDAATLPLGGLVLRAAQDVHPPLYYLVAKPFAHGWNVWLLRVPSAVAAAAAVGLLGAAAARVFGSRAGLALAALVALSPAVLQFAAEARQYALLLFWWALALWLLSVLNDRRWQRTSAEPVTLGDAGLWAAYAAAVLGGLYTHNLFVFLALQLGLLALAVAWAPRQGRARRLAVFVAAHLVVFFAWLPWLQRSLIQAGTVGHLEWIPWPRLGHLASAFFYFPFAMHEPLVPPWQRPLERTLTLAGPPLLLLAAWRLRRLPGARTQWAMLVLLAAGATALAFVLSHTMTRVFYAPRFSLFLTPTVLLALALLVAHPPRAAVARHAQAAVLAALVAVMLFHDARLALLPRRIEQTRLIDLLREQHARAPATTPYVTFGQGMEEHTFAAVAAVRGPELRWGSVEEMLQRLPRPTPERPIWIVIDRQGLVEGAVRVRTARAAVAGATLARPPIIARTFEAYLVEAMDWPVARRAMEEVLGLVGAGLAPAPAPAP